MQRAPGAGGRAYTGPRPWESGLPCHGGGSATRYIAAAMAEASDPPLPLDAQRALELAARSLFDTFSRTAMGTMVIDRQHRIVWISEG